MTKTLNRLLFLACILLIPGCRPTHADTPPLKVLFIGNSYTSVNDLPGLVEALAKAGGREIESDQSLPGGFTFEHHVKGKEAIEKIRARKWDVVVLQEQSLTPVLNRESMFKYARILHDEISKQGAKTVFYLTWARQDIPQMQEGADPAASPEYAQAMFQQVGMTKATDFPALSQQQRAGLMGGLNGAYFDVAKELHAQVAPVGMAWKKALAQNPKLDLYQADKSHPTPQGSYLAACVFYATLFNKSPVGLASELRKGFQVLVRLDPEEAKMLQETAWLTVQEAKQIQER